jgi:hypothetical protein
VEKYCRVGQATDDNMAHADEASTVSSASFFFLISSAYLANVEK